MYVRKKGIGQKPSNQTGGSLSRELNSFHDRPINTAPYRNDAATIAANEQILKALDTVAKNHDFLSGKKRKEHILFTFASLVAIVPIVKIMERIPKDQTNLMTLTKAVCVSLLISTMYHFFKGLFNEAPSHYSRGSDETLNESIHAVEKISDALKAGQLKDSPFSVQEEAVERVTAFKITSDTFGSGVLAYTRLNVEFLGDSDAHRKLKDFEELVSEGAVTSPKALAKLNATISFLKNWISKNDSASQTTADDQNQHESRKEDANAVDLDLNKPETVSDAGESKESTLIRVVSDESGPEVEFVYVSRTESVEDNRRKG